MANLFQKLFEKKELLDFSVLKTDMHSHLVPGIDDGSKSNEMSISMIEGLQELGFKKFITTPHCMAEVFPNTFENISATCELLNVAIEPIVKTSVLAAAEYYVDENFPARIRSGEQFLFFGDKYILLEVSMSSKEKKLEESIFELNLLGYKPVLAHVERYPYMFESNNLSYYRSLQDADVFLQVNLRSFIGQYGEIQKKIARQLAEHQMISFLGTDLHHENQLPAIELAMKDPYVQKLLASNTLLNSEL